MSEIKHTPGKWRWENAHSAGLQIFGNVNGVERMLFTEVWHQFPNREWDAMQQNNARLIAAAPDLLEALLLARKELEYYCDDLSGNNYNNFQINAAITKAIGE